MKVRAKQVGQYRGRIVERGEVFEIHNEYPRAHWMEEVVDCVPTVAVEKEKKKFKVHLKWKHFEIRIGGAE